MKKSLMTVMAIPLLAACVLTAATDAEARRGYVAGGIIGGLSANAIIASGAYPYYGYGYYPGYYAAAPAFYGPPPGCVIRRQRAWDGYAWRSQKIRVCH